MRNTNNLFSPLERIVMGLAVIAICIILGLDRSGKLTGLEWLKGVCGVAIAILGLYTFWKAWKRGDGTE